MTVAAMRIDLWLVASVVRTCMPAACHVQADTDCGLLGQANTGRTAVCTIHQPSIQIWESFDELLLLAPGGRTIYAGDCPRHPALAAKACDHQHMQQALCSPHLPDCTGTCVAILDTGSLCHARYEPVMGKIQLAHVGQAAEDCAGSLGRYSADLITYFEGVNGLEAMPADMNPATWMLQVSIGSLTKHYACPTPPFVPWCRPVP